MSPLDSPYFRRPRGRKQPLTFQVTVEYEQDLADLRQAAARLGQTEEAFFVFAARVASWLLSDVVSRDKTAKEGAA